MHLAHYPCAAPRRVASHLPFLPMDSPSAPPALLPGLRALPYGSSRRSLCPHSNQRLQRLPSPGASRRLVAAAAVDRLAPRRPEAGRLRWKYLLACRGPYDSGNGLAEPPPPPPSGESVDVWRPALRRWDVPWQWPTVSLTMVACALSSLLAGKVEQLVLEYLGYQAGEANIDEKAGVLFLEQLYGSNFFFLCLDTATQLTGHLLIEKTVCQHEIYLSFLVYKCSSVTAVAIGVMFGITNTFRPFSDDIFRYDLKEPFKLQNGWLLWAGIGLFFALVSIVLTGAAMSFLNGETTQREVDLDYIMLEQLVVCCLMEH